MASAEPGGTSAFAAELRAQRTARGWTQVELGKRIGYSGSFVSDVERGERAPSEDFAQRCDGAFELPGTFVRLYEDLRRNAYPPFFAPVVPLEREADRINGWSLGAVPGLLQTERYARSVIRAKRPRASDEEVERAVAARMDRQEILARPTPPRLWYVIAEGVLRHAIGDQEIMGEQLDKLIKSASLPGIVIQVLTYGAHDHPGVEGPIVVYEGQRMTAYTECVDGGRLVEEPGNVRDLMELIELLRAAALSPRESTRFMQERRRDLD
jgi:transcriptional regulator with XRE-family HTH domain